MDPDPAQPPYSDGPSHHGFSNAPDGLDGEGSGQVSPELRRICNLLEIVGDPTRLRILLSLYSEAKTTLDLVFELPSLTGDGMTQQIGFLRTKGLIETNGSGSYRNHESTDLGRQLALVALSLGIDWPG